MKRRKPNRLKGYDYSLENLYFVTSCVQDMICCFGEIRVGTGRDLSNKKADDANSVTGHDLSLQEPQMILNQYGKIANQQWYWLAKQYPYITLHEFTVMPNHMHGIIEIVGTGRDLSYKASDYSNVGTRRDLSNKTSDDANSGTGHDLSLPVKIKPLSELMGAYKTTVSKQIHLSGYKEFSWQRSFYDHIIRDEKSYQTISNYIINNVNSWQQDKFHVGTGRNLSNRIVR